MDPTSTHDDSGLIDAPPMLDSPEYERQSILDAACMLAFAVGSFPDQATDAAIACLAAMRVLGCSVPSHIPTWTSIEPRQVQGVYRALKLRTFVPCPDGDTSHAIALLMLARRGE
jgi:hypothetical protein